MTDLEKSILEQIQKISPVFSSLEFNAAVSISSYSIEFFITVDGQRRQCYDLADEGRIQEKTLEDTLAKVADNIRNSADFNVDQVNKLSFTFSK